MQRSARVFLALTCVSGFTVGFASSPASAKPSPGQVRTTIISRAALSEGGKAQQSARDRASAKREYIDAQARQGRLVDDEFADSSIVNGVAVVWDKPVIVNSVKVDVVSDSTPSPSPGAEGIGIQATVDEGSAPTMSPVSSGAGLDGLSEVGGGTRVGGWCVSTKSTTGNSLTSCFEKYRLTYKTATNDYFYYGRWATATGKAVDWAPDWLPTRIDLRSRPWTGYENQVKQLNNYWPKSGQKLCTASGEVGFEWQGFKASIPIQDCEDITPGPDATTHTMSVLYDQGAIFSGRSHGTEFGMVYATSKNANPPIADYNYAKYCRLTYADCDGVLRKDSGW